MTTRSIRDAVKLAPALEWALDNYPELVLRPSFIFRTMSMFGEIYRDEIGEATSEVITGGPSLQQIEHSLFAGSHEYREPLVFKIAIAGRRRPLEMSVHIDCVDRSFYGTNTTPLWLLGGELARASHRGRHAPTYGCSTEDALVLITRYEPRARTGNIILTPYVSRLVESGGRVI